MTTNQPYGPPPGVPRYSPKKKSWPRRHPIWTTLIVLFLIGLIGSACGGGNKNNDNKAAAPSTSSASSTSSSATQTTSKPAPVKAAGLGTSVRDGKFEFTVTKVRSGVHSVGPAEFGQTAQGQFVLVTVKVKNIGNVPRMLDSSSQYAYDATGNKLDSNASAGIAASPSGGGAYLNNINPGNAVTAVLVYDLPKTGRLVKLELHDSPFSGGVKVTL